MNLSEIYDEGWSAGYQDIYPACPYVEGSPEANAWYDGYADGSHNS